MINNIARIGRFTNSQIHKLTTRARDGKTFGAPALTYIEEKRAERSLGRSLELGATSQSMTTGKIYEYYCHKFHLGLEYSLVSKLTSTHPRHKFWSGSPDAEKELTAVEIKCYEPKNYYLYSMALLKLINKTMTLNEFKAEFKEEYYQVIGNAIILNKPKAELIAYTPTEEQLMQIRQEVEETSILESLGIEPWQGRFIFEKEIYNLPYIPTGIEYPNFVKYEFQVPADDIIFLTKCVLDAEKLLTA